MNAALLALGSAIVCTTMLLAPATSTVTAQDATPTPTFLTDLGLEKDSVLGLIGPNPAIRWRAVGGAAQFQLTATLTAARVNEADPICTPATQSENRTIRIDETLPGTATSFTVAFPPVAEGDAWFVSSSDVLLRVFASDGSQIGAQSGGGISESICSRPAATATAAPPAALPRTGASDAARRNNPSMVWVLLGAGFGAFAAGLRLRRRWLL
jgi:hypothetical protein